MVIKHNVQIYDICWLNHARGGLIGTFYEPETKKELIEICRSLYKEKKTFDLIGHTSNIYFLPSYSVGVMVSTRRLKDVYYKDDLIIADCGANVKMLARSMVNEGVKGFEGLVDLPGTIGAAVYGNASCYKCSVNDILVSVELLKVNGEIVTLKPEALKVTKRSSALKRGEIKGVILSVTLRKEYGDKEKLKTLALENHRRRLETQPGPKDNLGSIYTVSNGFSRKSWIIRKLASLLCILFKLIQNNKVSWKENKIAIVLWLYGAQELQPYVYGWNRYIWSDERSHELFWMFHKIHKKLFDESKFEIEIKG
jgi:UDP-N-acetylenolpyruvoylglucosamine reductase